MRPSEEQICASEQQPYRENRAKLIGISNRSGGSLGESGLSIQGSVPFDGEGAEKRGSEETARSPDVRDLRQSDHR